MKISNEIFNIKEGSFAGEKAMLLQTENGYKKCPFQPPIMLPGQLANQIQLVYSPCGSWCPHFEMTEYDASTGKKNQVFITLTCGGERKDFDNVPVHG